MLLRLPAALLVVVCSFVSLAHAQRNPRPRNPLGRSLPGGVIAEESFYLGGRVLYADTSRIALRISVKLFTSGGALAGLTFTDTRGQFEFRDLQRGVYLVEVAEEGYDTVQARVDLNLGSRYDTTILLALKAELTTTPPGDLLSVRELQVPPKARQAFEKGARELHDKQRPDKSIPYFREAIKLYPDYDAAYVQLALAHLQKNDPAEAEQVLKKAVEIYSENVQAQILLGSVYDQLGRPEEAVPWLRRALELDANAWHAHYELGKALLKLEEIEEAYEHARRAHDLNTQTPYVHLLLYNLCIFRRDYDTALAEADEFLELFPANPLAAKVRKQRAALLQSRSNASDSNRAP